MKEPPQRLAPSARILISAYACEPGQGSEPEVGWRWAVGLARFFQVTVLTRCNNRDSIEKATKDLPAANLNFIYYDPPRWLVSLKKRGLPTSLFYLAWQLGAARKIRRLRHGFDIVHHLTFNSFMLPGFHWFASPPIVLGPLGGGMTTARGHLDHFGRGAGLEILRTLFVRLAAFNPAGKTSYHFAKLILVANEDTEKRLPSRQRNKVRRVLETAAPEVTPPRGNGNTSKSFIWIGTLQRRKAPLLAIRAFEKVSKLHPDASLTIVGAGPMERVVKDTIEALGLRDRVKMTGRLSRKKVSDLLAGQTALLFTSVRDTSGNVILEAMAMGLPVIAFHHQGVRQMLTESTGYLIPPVGGAADELRFAEAMERIIANPSEAMLIGENGRRAAATSLSWEEKFKEVTPWLRQLAGKSSEAQSAI